MYGLDSSMEHRCKILFNVAESKEFGWILPLPGLLHVEINACRAFFARNWNIFMEDVCSQLGFGTPKSLAYAKKCSDHHKSWTILEILYIAATD